MLAHANSTIYHVRCTRSHYTILLLLHCCFELVTHHATYAAYRRRTQKLHLDTALGAAIDKEIQERVDIHKLQQVRLLPYMPHLDHCAYRCTLLRCVGLHVGHVHT
jgi:hypothetical protein